MAKVVLIKDLSELRPSITNVVISSMLGKIQIDKFDPSKVYNAGDKIYIINEGDIIVKECINDNTTSLDDKYWITVDTGIGGGSTTQNPNSNQNISYFENKLVTDIGILSARVNTLLNMDSEGLTNVHIVPMYEQSELNIVKGRFEFGRIFI